MNAEQLKVFNENVDIDNHNVELLQNKTISNRNAIEFVYEYMQEADLWWMGLVFILVVYMLLFHIRVNQLEQRIDDLEDIEDCRPEIFTKGNKVDCMIVDLEKDKRKVNLSIKELEKYNEKLAIKKYGKDGSSSGAVLGDILGKVFRSKKKKEKK